MTNNHPMSNEADSTGEYLIPNPKPKRVRVELAARTHAGKVRANNEDQFLIARLAKSMRVCQTSLPMEADTLFSDEEGYLLIVADGMGGAAAGEEASAMAVSTIEDFVLNTIKWFLHFGQHEESTLMAELRQALENADRNVMDRAEAEPSLRGMGTTLTMGFSIGTDLFILHAGDSRAYLFQEGELSRLTLDHTLVQMLIDGGIITPEAARTHHRRNVVTNVVGGPSPGVHAEIHKVPLTDGDLLLLCTDGLTEPVSEDRIREILRESHDLEDLSQRLLDATLDAGAPDNITLIVARYHVD